MRSGSSAANRFMTPGRWAILGTLAAILILLLLNLYYQWIQTDIWQEERAAERIAVDAAQLTDISETEKFVWDEVVWIVRGSAQDGQQLMVWVTDGKADVVPASEGVTEQTVREKLLAARPGADIIRIRPGLYNGQKIWEAYYSLPEKPLRYYYEFFAFADGSPVSQFRLTNKYSS
ncbi:hypothetical protein DNH61_23425 [Paenibacillus sambharensis]|uniref:Cell wall elongation regulator TseB-like domain-containing protein n=1 Tax=Paenibacillus sambharensis TaxID=1803190 RepID=A0A2W1LES1_9BACL|nr:DUF5590 domain-containing protein [Paenibacillus sambharensis]PZD93572.1 hypothetical protein DNH61_23425 [Paenibacillus sambharensis]